MLTSSWKHCVWFSAVPLFAINLILHPAEQLPTAKENLSSKHHLYINIRGSVCNIVDESESWIWNEEASSSMIYLFTNKQLTFIGSLFSAQNINAKVVWWGVETWRMVCVRNWSFRKLNLKLTRWEINFKRIKAQVGVWWISWPSLEQIVLGSSSQNQLFFATLAMPPSSQFPPLYIFVVVFFSGSNQYITFSLIIQLIYPLPCPTSTWKTFSFFISLILVLNPLFLIIYGTCGRTFSMEEPPSFASWHDLCPLEY